ncbi:hypothetical protein [Pseudomonas amygdali]|uniref:hypothetical protein n=1 Tax=Pseudomonas amygdali TaxID=47877 RepID=UPI0006E65592|nr:hypothetical protein [Pseudomonas amygdali]KPY54141.1 Uncharacterized protein ALO93_04019 [Pseudomonas amygdali pv. sesami]RMT98700.1 hypothetical protein ALP37_02351 [Pseudomonas amygdali pv. sesami]
MISLKNEQGRFFTWIVALIAVLLSSVTAMSVGIAMFTLIDNLFMATVFAGAAVVLDLYKYLAWPLAIGAWIHGKKISALLMVMTAITLGAISAWATYDRMYSSVTASHSRYLSAQIKISQLKSQQATELDRLKLVDAETRSMSEQARLLRERGMVTKAQDLDALAISSAADQRQRILDSVDAIAKEVSDQQAHPVPSASLPAVLLTMVCAGFALALEIVPALLGAALRAGNKDNNGNGSVAESTLIPCLGESGVETEPPALTTVAIAEPVTIATGLEAQITLPVAMTTGQQQDLFGADDSRLMQTLISMTQSTKPGTPIKVRDFTAAARVGNRRTIKLFHAAMEVGLLKRTSVGYVAA